jgi:hypothetical protein
MRYLKTFESFGGGQEDCTQIAAEILAMAGEDVTPQEIEKSVETSLEKGAQGQAQAQMGAQGQAQMGAQGQAQMQAQFMGESVQEILMSWWDLMNTVHYSHDTAEYEMTLGAIGAWLATLVSGGVIGWSIYKLGKKIKGLFGGKEVDFNEFVEKWLSKNGKQLVEIDFKSKEGKSLMAKMLTDFKNSGGKI